MQFLDNSTDEFARHLNMFALHMFLATSKQLSSTWTDFSLWQDDDVFCGTGNM